MSSGGLGVCRWTVLLVAALYVCFGVHLVSGKCAGQWAIHACAGGNGKRSDTQLPVEYRREPQRVSLEKLILSAANRGNLESQPSIPIYRTEEQRRNDKVKTLWKKLLLALAEKDDA